MHLGEFFIGMEEQNMEELKELLKMWKPAKTNIIHLWDNQWLCFLIVDDKKKLDFFPAVLDHHDGVLLKTPKIAEVAPDG